MTQRRRDATDGPSDGMIEDVRNLGVRVSDELHAWLTALAEREHRSLNGQVVWMLERERERQEREAKPERDS
jgi:hypothetical protein